MKVSGLKSGPKKVTPVILDTGVLVQVKGVLKIWLKFNLIYQIYILNCVRKVVILSISHNNIFSDILTWLK